MRCARILAFIVGVTLGVLWACSGLAVNLLHLALGSLFIGFYVGHVPIALIGRRHD